jgi:putative transposase
VTAERKEAAQDLVGYGLSVVKACLLTGLSRASFYRGEKDWKEADSAVIDALNAVLEKAPQSGFWKCFHRIRFKGLVINHKRLYRVYCKMGLNLPRRVKKRLPPRDKQPLVVVEQANCQWALDFVHDSLYSGKRFRTLNVLDEGTRECIAIEVDTSLPA